jgi:AcrR family transcriptional regulator
MSSPGVNRQSAAGARNRTGEGNVTRNAADDRTRQGGGDRIDRRVRRTQHALLHALMELVVERGYDRVTVQDIIDRADVGRSTFYSHFRDKEDLFLSGFDDELRETFGSSDAFAEGEVGSDEPPSLRLFRHAARHEDLYRVLARRRGAWPVVRRRMEETLTEVFEQRLRQGPPQQLPVEVVARYLASGLLGVLSWWLEDGMRLDAAVMDQSFRVLASEGVRVALGVAF